MSTSAATKLSIIARDVSGGSRSARRLRRTGRVPGVLYGGDGGAIAFDTDARELRHALAASGAVLELDLDGETRTAVVKESQHHPVTGVTTHVDFVRVRLDVAITATVPLELTGNEDAPGVKEGGVFEQQVREILVEALPNEIPEAIFFDVSEAVIGDTVFLTSVVAPAGATIVEENPEEIVVFTLSAPRLSTETDEEIETETGVVGEDAAADSSE